MCMSLFVKSFVTIVDAIASSLKIMTMKKKYVDLILKEWGMYKTQLGFTPVINSLHFGGGTPTFLSAENLEKLRIY